MLITWLGQSCFKIQDKTGSEGITVVTDPYETAQIGLKMPSFEADVITVSHDHKDHNCISALRGKPYVIDCAGEYDVKNVMVEGVASFHDEKQGAELGNNIIYRIEMDGITICHLGDLGHVLEAKQLDRLQGIDILLIPVGGKYTIDADRAVEVINLIEPRIVIPMHYKVPGLKVDIAAVDAFVKEFGVKPTYEDKLKIAKKELPAEDTELVILSLQN